MIATYRLQLTPAFGFAQASACLPYLRRLGITHLHLSPITEARPGSIYGYDVVDHNAVRTELGGALQLQLLLAAARQLKLKVILDIVPNHAGVGAQNHRFEDVLTYGPHSPYARYFDIEWNPLKPELHNRVLLPFLAGHYGAALSAGEVDIRMASGRLFACYGPHRFALMPKSYTAVLLHVLPELALGDSERAALTDLLQRLQHWAPADRPQGEELIKGLHALVSDAQFAAAWRPMGAGDLHALLETQYWRLCNWRNCAEEINYRRFFDANHLIGLRVEDPRVFTSTHRLVKEMLCDSVVEGLRIDHIDGLSDPHTYLERLRTLGAKHVWVEKVLAPDEALPAAWPVEGSTGYEFGADVTALCTHSRGRTPLTRLYRNYVRDGITYAAEVHRSKRLVMSTQLTAELQRLAFELDRLSETDFRTRDFTQQALRDGIMEVIAGMRRHRTYLPQPGPEAPRVISRGVNAAVRRNPAADPGSFRLVGRLLQDTGQNARLAAWVVRFQQYSATVADQGVHDTAFCRYTRLLGLNEVGNNPGKLGISVRAFHRRAQARQRRFPNNLLATQSHVHQRGEDLRMRLVVLSEIPDAWRACLRALHATSRQYRRRQGPSRHDMYAFFQLLVATWDPLDRGLAERLAGIMERMARQAKQNTSWTYPQVSYESALRDFVHAVVGDAQVAEVVAPLAAKLQHFGLYNTLTQLVLKCTVPGVPDFYLGSEFLDLTSYGPTWAPTVDFVARQRLLDELDALLMQPNLAVVHELLRCRPDAAKMYVMARLLRLRHAHAELVQASYQPVAVEGARRGHVIAFTRGSWLVVVPRLLASLERLGGWEDTRVCLPEALRGRRLREALTDVCVAVDDVLELREMPMPWGVLRSTVEQLVP